MNKKQYTWDDFFKDADKLTKKIPKDYFKSILIVTKGGLFLGAYLSQVLNIAYVDTVGLRSYEGTDRKELLLIKRGRTKMPFPMLIVDDIVDSGETLKFLYKEYKAVSVALVWKRHADFAPTYFAREVGDEWIVFPWEVLKGGEKK